jgi:multicomponent Na+:H+ antiporter subunit G
MFVAAVGLVRLNGLFLKMHAATKTGTLGAGLILLGVGIQLEHMTGIVEVVLLILFIAMTNPISAHLIAKSQRLSE